VLRSVDQALEGREVDLVLSDMAPNISGVASTDQARSAHLVELAVEFALSHLKPGGALLVKAFHGGGMDQIRKDMARVFDSVVVRKPRASRDRSSEFYLLAKGPRGALPGVGAGVESV
jgi:23S rRNA (uridine2552-2'-O)-methyltransferase